MMSTAASTTDTTRIKYKFNIITLFPELFNGWLDCGIVQRAITAKKVEFNFANPRDFTQNKNRRVDDRPYGGGPGMLMQVEPLLGAIDYLNAERHYDRSLYKIILSPQGKKLDQPELRKLAKIAETQDFILIAGRYAGIDARLNELAEIDVEYSVGDFVVSGGEVPAMLLLDGLVRLLPGVLGNDESMLDESFTEDNLGLLDCPYYTRPAEIDGIVVPEVLQNGNHSQILRWRWLKRLEKTWNLRPNSLQLPDGKLKPELRAQISSKLEQAGVNIQEFWAAVGISPL